MIRFLLSERQMARISPYFPLSHRVPRGRKDSRVREKRHSEGDISY